MRGCRQQDALGSMLHELFRVLDGRGGDSPGWDPDAFLKWEDLSWLGDRVVLHIRQSKTDRFRKGESVELCQTGHQLCPVEALRVYRNCRGGGGC